jgi:hypothetical protein
VHSALLTPHRTLMVYDLPVARMRLKKMQTGFLLESVKQRYLLEGLGADGRIILNCILSKCGGRA